jgi:hypothetical protein
MKKLIVSILLFFLLTKSFAQTHLSPADYKYEFPVGNFRSIIETMELNKPANDSSFIPGVVINDQNGKYLYDINGRVVSRITYDPNKLYFKDSLTYSAHGILIKATCIMDDYLPDTLFKPIYLNAAYLQEYQYYYSVVCDTAYLPDIFCYTFDILNQCIRTQIGNTTDTIVFENVTDTGWVCKYLYRNSDTSAFYTGQIDSIVRGKRMVSLIYYRDSIGKRLHSYLQYTYTKDGLIESVNDKQAVINKPKKTQLSKQPK